MKTRTIVLALVALFVAVAVCVAADDVNMGTFYDVVGSVKTHLDCGSRDGLFFFNQGLLFFSFFSTKARTVNPAVEKLVPPAIYSASHIRP